MTNVTSAVDILHQAERDWEYLSEEERRGTIDEALNQLVETGEQISESPVTGEKYRVTKWIDHGEGKITAIEKEPLESDSDA